MIRLIEEKPIFQPEGVKREYTHNVYFCPNERITISTPPDYSIQFVRLPKDNSTSFNFLVKGKIKLIWFGFDIYSGAKKLIKIILLCLEKGVM